MNTNIKTNRLDEETWERYRTKIENLYWENSLDKIDAHMKKHHGFFASKSQYERHFRKWKLRKNLTTDEWVTTIRYLTNNSIRLERFEVLFKGREIPQNRILQEIARRNSPANTLHDGPHKLPKDIIVQPRSHAPTIDAANGLQIIPAPVARSPSPSMQLELDFGLAKITSTSVYDFSFNTPTLVAEYSLPFSWTHSINFESISQSLFPSQQLVKWQKPSNTQLDAIFHSKHQPLVDTTYGSHSTTPVLYTLASLANNVSSVGHTNSYDAYELLKALPLSDVSRSLKGLPGPILDAIKERVFATAVQVEDVDLVSTMLELDMNPREQIMMDWPHQSRPTYPLQFSVAACHFAVAKTLISHMCRGATQLQLEEVMDHVFKGENLRGRRSPRDSADFSESERTELMCIALRAGATPCRRCLGSKPGSKVSVASLKQMMEATRADVIKWLEMGLLDHWIEQVSTNQRLSLYDKRQRSLDKDMLRNILYFYQNRLPMSDQRPRRAILHALRVAVAVDNRTAVELLFEAFSLLGYHLNNEDTRISGACESKFPDELILQAVGTGDWALAASFMMARRPASKPEESHTSDHEISAFERAIQLRKLGLAFHRYTRISAAHVRAEMGECMVELAVSQRDRAMAITIVEEMESRTSWVTYGLAILLRHGQITTVSTLLTRNPVWKCALEAASHHNDFGALEAMFFHGSAVPFIKVQEEGSAILQRDKLQLCFRTVAYHAMASNNQKLCKWLFQLGMDADEWYMSMEEGAPRMKKCPGLRCSLPGGIGTLPWEEVDEFALPSLLAIAAAKNNIGWMVFLVAEGVCVVDSMALLQAIRSNAAPMTICLLLDAAKAGRSSAEKAYGVAALRQAIRYRDITRINLLCSAVNLDGIEPFAEEFLARKSAISPLGEAIIANDSEIVQALLKQGASPNAYVSFEGLRRVKHIKSHIQKVTPLLAAVDMRSLPLVKILLGYGAELQYTHNMGISRTPLQRAAETGSFDIVEYLVGHGAIIDTVPVYSSGTALQLAAMNGFCGVAAFLLEHGADPIYPPAKGHGRTAFEAAAEWGHVDTMSLLIQWNVNLDAQFGEPPESQYERARRFAEKNGFMASKRFVEHLYGQKTRDESWPAGLALDSM